MASSLFELSVLLFMTPLTLCLVMKSIIIMLSLFQLTLAKRKGDYMGLMVIESGYGSAIPSCVIAHLNKTGAAMKSGLLNVGDHIISINGVNLVGISKKACVEQLKVFIQDSCTITITHS